MSMLLERYVEFSRIITKAPIFLQQILQFRGAICEILRYCYPHILYILQPVGIVVLNDNTSKYNEFIVTCNTKTHYIRPLMNNCSFGRRIYQCHSRTACHLCHKTYNYHISKLIMTRFYCFINGKIKKKPEKP